MTDKIQTPETTYEVIRHLGEGGMGQVLLVQSPRQPEPVALKFLQSQWTTDVRVEGFKREFALLSELHHPHLPQVYDFELASSHNQYLFTTEFVEGQELYRALRQAPFEESENVLIQVLSALDFLHSIGLVHFDVKGENVLVSRTATGTWNAKLVDFGVTSPANRELTEVAGTLHYLAPELLLPDPVSDGRCDLYSFGVMCYYLLAGQFPYTLNSFDDVWVWHRAHPHIDLEPLKVRGVPDYFCQMIARLLRPNPSERFSSAGIVLNYIAIHSGKSHGDIPTLQRAQIAEGPFVGRAGLMATVKNALQSATKHRSKRHPGQENTPHAFLLSGRDGMGKTRFLKELKCAAQLIDYSVRVVDAADCGTTMDRFRIALGILRTGMTPEETLAALLAEASQRSLCLAVDNLHEAAPAVKQFLNSVMGSLYNSSLVQEAPPLVVIATTMDDKLPTTLGAVHVAMAPLRREEVESYLRQLIGSPEDFDSFLTWVWEFSGGIPLLMTEAARQYHLDAELPTSIEDLYRRQLVTVSKPGMRILQTLAFAAVPLPAAILELVAGVPLDKETLPLQQAGLLTLNDDTGHCALSTGALASALVGQLTPELRSFLADPLIAWVESTPGASAMDAARYAMSSRDLVRASRILDQAIEICERSGKVTQAAVHLHQLAQIRQDLGMTGEVIALKRRIATHLLFQGRLDDSEKMVYEIVTLTGGDRKGPATEELKLLGLIHRVRRKPEEAGAYYDQALAMVVHDPADPVYLFLQNERALAYLEAGQVGKAIPMLMQTHRDAKALPFEKQRRVSNNNLGAALAKAGQMAEAIIFYKEKLGLFQHDLRLQGSIYSQLASVQLRAGQLDDAIASFEAAWQIATQTGDMHSGKIILDNIISLLQKKSAYSKALQHAKKSLELKSVGNSPQDMGRTLMTLATLYLNLGVPDLAARYLIQGMRIVRRCKDHKLLGWIQITFGYLYKDLGRLMESINAFEETMFIGEEHTDEELMRWGRYGAADVLVDHGELEEAKPYMAALETILPTVTDPEFRARVEIVKARIEVLKTPKPGLELSQRLMALVDECRKNNWSELEWEAEYFLGSLFQKRDEFDQVRHHLGNASTIITGIADGLGEEYRDGFLKHRVRARVFSELNAAENNEVYITEVTSMSESPSTPPPGDDEVSKATSVFAVVSSSGHTIKFDPAKPLMEYEREIIEATLVYYHNDLAASARALDITEDALHWKLSLLGLEVSDPAPEPKPMTS